MINIIMRAYEFIEGMYNKGGSMYHTIDPLIDTMPGLFGKRRKGKKIPDAPDAPYATYPKNLYGTTRMITPSQRDALEGDGQFKMYRELWHNTMRSEKKKAETAGRKHVNGSTEAEQKALHVVGNYRDELFQHLGLPSVYG